MKITPNEFNAVVYTIPKDIVLTSSNFMIDNKGYEIVGKVPDSDVNRLEVSLHFSGEEVELSKFEKEVLKQIVLVNAQLI